MNQDSLLRTDKEFVALYERNVKRIYQICYMHMQNMADAEDAVQTVFLKYIRSKKEFTDWEHEKAWFIVTAQNYCRDVFRLSWRRARTVSMDVVAELAAEDGKEEHAALMDALLRLPSKYKDILHLYYFEGYAVKEISAMLKRNESTIRSQLRKGRERLKLDLEHEMLIERKERYVGSKTERCL